MKRIPNLNHKEKEKALDLYRKSIVINTNDSTRHYAWPQKYFPKLHKGGITTPCVTVCHPSSKGLPPPIYEPNFRIVVNWIHTWYGILREIGSSKVFLATTAEHVEKAKKEAKVGVVFMLQGANSVEELMLLTILHKLGIRIMGLTYMRRNYIGTGCMERADCGLSKYGVEVVEEMNKVGMLIDLSHTGYATSMDAIEISQNPCIFSHSNPATLCDAVRNAKDDQLMALAEKDGVIGITSPWWFLPAKYEKEPTAEDYLDAMEYAINCMGVDHIGVGMDMTDPEGRRKEDVQQLQEYYPDLNAAARGKFDVWPVKSRYAKGLEAHTALPIAEGLVARGYSNQEIQKILGLNFMRVFKRVWGS